MLNLDFLADDFSKYGVLCENVQQARSLWDAVAKRWPRMVSNWQFAGPPVDPSRFTNRIFRFVKSSFKGMVLIHGDESFASTITVVPFESLLELPEFEAEFGVEELFR